SGAGMAAAFIDVSTGEFLVTEFPGEQAWTRLVQELERFQPREILYPQSLEPLVKRSQSSSEPALFEVAVTTPLEDWNFEYERSNALLRSHFGVASLDGFGLLGKQFAISAAGAILYYVRETQKEAAAHVTGLGYYEPANFLILDAPTV